MTTTRSRSPFLLTLGLGLGLGLTACTGGQSDVEEEHYAFNLRDSLGETDVEVVGATVAFDTGIRYVLDANRGIYQIDQEGSATLVLSLEEFPQSEIAPVSAFTDITYLGADRFALTARNDGFLLDLHANTLQRHFCYLPDDLPIEDVHQLTKSVTYDPSTDLIFAQPQTVSDLDGTILGSSVGRFAGHTGEDLQWFNLSDFNYIAGGITFTGPGELVLGSGSQLDRFNTETGFVEGGVDLERFGVTDVAGLATDVEQGTLLVVDGATDRLVEVPLTMLGDQFPQ